MLSDKLYLSEIKHKA